MPAVKDYRSLPAAKRSGFPGDNLAGDIVQSNVRSNGIVKGKVIWMILPGLPTHGSYSLNLDREGLQSYVQSR